MPDGRIILVRHGETEANRVGRFASSDKIELTDEGRKQAERLALTIEAQFRPARILTSNFRRARQTAAIVSKRLGVPIHCLDGIHERDFGSLKGEPYNQMGEIMRGDTQYRPETRWLWAPANGESLQAVQARAIQALRQVASAYPNLEVVVVSHGAVMESVGAYMEGNWEAASVPPNCGMILIEPSRIL